LFSELLYEQVLYCCYLINCAHQSHRFWYTSEMSIKNLPEMPCAPIMELNCQRKRLFVPYGFKPLLEKMALDVIKEQPENMYDYLASFMEDRARQKAEEKAAKAGKRTWEYYLWSWEGSSILSPDLLLEFLVAIRISQGVATRCAIIIQKTYRGFLGRLRVKNIRRIRSRQTGFHKPGRDSRKYSDDSSDLSTDEPVEEPVDEFEFLNSIRKTAANRHATTIQKVFKGFQARKLAKELKDKELAGPAVMGETDVDKVGGESGLVSKAPSEMIQNGEPIMVDNYQPGNDNYEEEEEESDFDSRTYEVEEESDFSTRTYEVDVEGMDGFGTTDEEEEESLAEEEDPSLPPPDQSQQDMTKP